MKIQLPYDYDHDCPKQKNKKEINNLLYGFQHIVNEETQHKMCRNLCI